MPPKPAASNSIDFYVEEKDRETWLFSVPPNTLLCNMFAMESWIGPKDIRNFSLHIDGTDHPATSMVTVQSLLKKGEIDIVAFVFIGKPVSVGLKGSPKRVTLTIPDSATIEDLKELAIFKLKPTGENYVIQAGKFTPKETENALKALEYGAWAATLKPVKTTGRSGPR